MLIIRYDTYIIRNPTTKIIALNVTSLADKRTDYSTKLISVSLRKYPFKHPHVVVTLMMRMRRKLGNIQ